MAVYERSSLYNRVLPLSASEWEIHLELNPNHSGWYTVYLIWMGRLDEAVAQTERSLKAGDPLSYVNLSNSGRFFYSAREPDRAIGMAHRILELHPDDSEAHSMLGRSYAAKGMDDQAFEALMQGDLLDDTFQEREAALISEAYKQNGLQSYYRWQLDMADERGVRPHHRAVLHAQLGEKDEAFEWLNKAYEQPIWQTCFSHRFDSLRGDPRFEQLLRKLNLPEEATARHLALP